MSIIYFITPPSKFRSSVSTRGCVCFALLTRGRRSRPSSGPPPARSPDACASARERPRPLAAQTSARWRGRSDSVRRSLRRAPLPASPPCTTPPPLSPLSPLPPVPNGRVQLHLSGRAAGETAWSGRLHRRVRQHDERARGADAGEWRARMEGRQRRLLASWPLSRRMPWRAILLLLSSCVSRSPLLFSSSPLISTSTSTNDLPPLDKRTRHHHPGST